MAADDAVDCAVKLLTIWSTRMPTGNWSLAPWPPLALACSFSSSTVISGGSGSANPTAAKATEPRNQALGSPKVPPVRTQVVGRKAGSQWAVVWILEIQETVGKGGEVKAGDERESSTRRTQAERERGVGHETVHRDALSCLYPRPPLPPPPPRCPR
jgi:hypothetical protein